MRMLFVPGFVVDTYSEIERSYVELCAQAPQEFLWLVPEVSSSCNSFARPDRRHELTEPAYLPDLRAKGVPYVVASVSKYNVIANLRLFARIFASHRIDAVYTHFGHERFWAAVCARLWGKRVVWNEHWHSLGRRYGTLKRLFYRLFVDEFVSVSRFITTTLPRSHRVHTLPNAVHVGPETRLTAEQRSDLRSQLGLPHGGKVVLMVAAFRPEKRHHLALRVCESVLRQRQDIVFVFLGGGRLRKSFVEEVRARGLINRVYAPGYVSNVDDYYAIADVSILTSLREPFGYVVLEAMRRCVPVVAFNSGGPAEVIVEGRCGFLVEEGNVEDFTVRLLWLLDDDTLRATMGSAARELVRSSYNREVWTADLLRVLRYDALTGRAQETRSVG